MANELVPTLPNGLYGPHRHWKAKKSRGPTLIRWFWGGDSRVYIMELSWRVVLRSYHDISPHNCHRVFSPQHVPKKFMKNVKTKNFRDPRNQHPYIRGRMLWKNVVYLKRGHIQSTSGMGLKKVSGTFHRYYVPGNCLKNISWKYFQESVVGK